MKSMETILTTERERHVTERWSAVEHGLMFRVQHSLNEKGETHKKEVEEQKQFMTRTSRSLVRDGERASSAEEGLIRPA